MTRIKALEKYWEGNWQKKMHQELQLIVHLLNQRQEEKKKIEEGKKWQIE